jgi:hypothetical protein
MISLEFSGILKRVSGIFKIILMILTESRQFFGEFPRNPDILLRNSHKFSDNSKEFSAFSAILINSQGFSRILRNSQELSGYLGTF